jgi:hypothetical protein
MTPISTIVSAYERFLDDDSLYGRVVECSADKQFFLEPPTLANGYVAYMYELYLRHGLTSCVYLKAHVAARCHGVGSAV